MHTHSQVLVHDFTSFKIQVIEVHHASWLSSKLSSGGTENSMHMKNSRTHSNHFLFIRNFCIPSMVVLLHFLRAFHPSEEITNWTFIERKTYSSLRSFKPCSLTTELSSFAISSSSCAKIASLSSDSSV